MTDTPIVRLRRDAMDDCIPDTSSKFGVVVGCIFGAFLIIGSIVLYWNISNLPPHP